MFLKFYFKLLLLPFFISRINILSTRNLFVPDGKTFSVQPEEFCFSCFYIMGYNIGSYTQGGLRAISCQADKLPKQKDTHRKPLLPTLPGS